MGYFRSYPESREPEAAPRRHVSLSRDVLPLRFVRSARRLPVEALG